MRILIGPLAYTVRAYTDDDDNHECHQGECCYVTQEILIDGSMPADRQASVLLHELGHALLEVHGEDADEMDEEDLCDFIGGPIAAVLCANPHLMRALTLAWQAGTPIVMPPPED